MNEKLVNEIQEYFEVERVSDNGSLLIHTPLEVDGEPFDLYVFNTDDNKYLITDFGRFLKAYLSDEQSEEYYIKSVKDARLEIIGKEIMKTVDDPEDVLQWVFEVLSWCAFEKLRNLAESFEI